MIKIKENIPLANFTTFRLGGPARFFVEVGSEDEIKEALKYAAEKSLDFFILGGGSNILVSDKGFDGLVIKIKSQRSKIKITSQNSKNAFLECWAGENLAALVNFSARNGLSGLEWAAGIPGTVGGAIRGNAGAFGGSMGDVVESVRALKIDKKSQIFSGQMNQKAQASTPVELLAANYPSRDCRFVYRSSLFKENPNLIISGAVIKLRPGNKAEIENKIEKTIAQRSAKQPKGASAGSFFLNPVVTDEKLRHEFEKETGLKLIDQKIPAGWLISYLDLCGKKVGGAMVASENGNWIINTGAATAEDIIILASIIKQKVRVKLGIQLKEEVQYLGF